MNRGDSGAAEIVIVERRGDGSEPRHDPHERDIGAVGAGEEPLEVVLRADEKGTAALALKKRLTLRGDARQYVIFNANHTQRIQELSGALAVYF